MMIAYIDAYRDRFGVEPICRVLGASLEGGFITSRGYRSAKSRPASARSIRDRILINELEKIHAKNYGVYGVRKMWHAAKRAGWDIGRDHVARLMKIAGIEGVRRGRTNHNQTRCGSRFSPGSCESTFQGQQAKPAVGCGYYICANPIRLRVYSVRHRRVLAQDCGLGDALVDENPDPTLGGA